jgi:hypothetical protein
MLELKMQQMRRYAFIVRVVRCRVHKVCIIYVEAVTYILAKIHKKNRKHHSKPPQIGDSFRPIKDRKRRRKTPGVWTPSICGNIDKTFRLYFTSETSRLKGNLLRQLNAPPRPNMFSNLTYDGKHHKLQTPYHHRNH